MTWGERDDNSHLTHDLRREGWQFQSHSWPDERGMTIPISLMIWGERDDNSHFTHDLRREEWQLLSHSWPEERDDNSHLTHDLRREGWQFPSHSWPEERGMTIPISLMHWGERDGNFLCRTTRYDLPSFSSYRYVIIPKKAFMSVKGHTDMYYTVALLTN